jgi:hypothetical protein
VKKTGWQHNINAFRETNNFLRKYCVVALGDERWRSKNPKSTEPVPREKEFYQIWFERGIQCFKISEFRTSKVIINF